MKLAVRAPSSTLRVMGRAESSGRGRSGGVKRDAVVATDAGIRRLSTRTTRLEDVFLEVGS